MSAFTVDVATKFVQLTRVYRKKGDAANAAPHTGSVTVAVAQIAAVRASNRLGYPEHRTTITLASGVEMELANSYSDVRKMLGLVG